MNYHFLKTKALLERLGSSDHPSIAYVEVQEVFRAVRIVDDTIFWSDDSLFICPPALSQMLKRGTFAKDVKPEDVAAYREGQREGVLLADRIKQEMRKNE